MSDGSYCIIRDLGLVKGGKGLRCFQRLLTLTPKGIVVESAQHLWCYARRLYRDARAELNRRRDADPLDGGQGESKAVL